MGKDSPLERWERRYRDETPPHEPSPFLTGLDDLLPRSGRALDVAGGAGRHAIWLANRGLDVTLADISPTALGIARTRAGAIPLTTLGWDLEEGGIPPGPWDLILIYHYLHRPLLADAARQMKPGGLLLFCQPTRINLERHARPPAPFLLEPGEIRHLATGLQLLLCEEGWLEEGRHEARIVARR